MSRRLAEVPRPAAATTTATNTHYDEDPRIFESFLDSRMKYSSALFEDPGEPLQRAVERKLDFVAEVLQAVPGERLLDIGCGWGSVVLDFASRGMHVTGVTPSPRQAEFIQRRHGEMGRPSTLRLCVSAFEAAELEPASFDMVTMLGSIVHMPDQAWVLRRVRELLRPGGRLYLSETCFRTEAMLQRFDQRPGTAFVRQHIFGFGVMTPLSGLVRHTEEAGFSLRSLTDLTDSYRLTIQHWRDRAEANRAALDAIRPGLTDELVRYFDVANAGWGFTTKHYALTASASR